MKSGKGLGYPALVTGLAVVMVAIVVWGQYFAPCGCFAGTPAADVPNRCIGR